jgi:flagellin
MNAGNAMVAALQSGGTGGGTAGSLLATAYQTYSAWVAGHGGDLTGADTAVQSTLLPLVTAAGVTNPNLVAAEAGKAASAIFNAAYTAAGGTLGLATSVTLGTPETVAGLAALGLSTPVTPGAPGGGLGVAGLSLTSKASSLSALASIDAALATISSNRATLGATGNRLQSAIANIQSFSESLSAANSRIKDVDVAEETSRMSRSQILMQAGISVLAQANQIPQMALKLLG